MLEYKVLANDLASCHSGSSMTMDGPLGHGLPAYSLDNAPDIRKFTP